VARLPGIHALQVREGAPGFVERTSVCVQRTGAHRARHPSDFPAHPRRATGAPFGRHPAAEATARS